MTLQQLLDHVQAEIGTNNAKAMVALDVRNELGYNAYLERAIALEDLLTWVKQQNVNATSHG